METRIAELREAQGMKRTVEEEPEEVVEEEAEPEAKTAAVGEPIDCAAKRRARRGLGNQPVGAWSAGP